MQREPDRACALGLVWLVTALKPAPKARRPQRSQASHASAVTPTEPASATERAAAGSAPPGSGTTNSIKMYVAAALIKLITGNAIAR
jgi:hypothetical protein